MLVTQQGNNYCYGPGKNANCQASKEDEDVYARVLVKGDPGVESLHLKLGLYLAAREEASELH